MKALETALITDGKSMPIKSGTLDFLRYSFQELFAELAQEIYPSLDPSQVNVLRGATYTVSAGTYTLQPGAVLYNGEIFLITSVQTLTPAAGSNAILAIDTTYYTGNGYNADPVIFSDGNPYYVHQVRTIILAEDVLTPTGNRVCNLSAMVYHAISNIGEIKMYYGDLSVFDSSGLGLPNSSWYGWALCNGTTFSTVNGPVMTANLLGRFVVGYDPGDSDYNALGNQNSSLLKTVTLTTPMIPSHAHGPANGLMVADGGGYLPAGGGGPADGQDGVNSTVAPHGGNSGVTDATGGDGPHENRPPYFTLAFVQRIF